MAATNSNNQNPPKRPPATSSASTPAVPTAPTAPAAPTAIKASIVKTATTAMKPGPSTSGPAAGPSSSKPTTKPVTGSATSRPVLPPRTTTNVSASHKSKPSANSADEAKKPLAATARKGTVAPSTSARTMTSKPAPATVVLRPSVVKKPATVTTSTDKGKAKALPTTSKTPAPVTTGATTATKAAVVTTTTTATKPGPSVSRPTGSAGPTKNPAQPKAGTSANRPVLAPRPWNAGAGHKSQSSLSSGDEVKKALAGTARKASIVPSTNVRTTTTRTTAAPTTVAPTTTPPTTAPKPKSSRTVSQPRTTSTSSAVKKPAMTSLDKGKGKASSSSQPLDELEVQKIEHERVLADMQAKLDYQREATSSLESRNSALASEVEILKSALTDAESSMAEAATEHQNILKGRDQEIAGMSQVIKRLQDEQQKQQEKKEEHESYILDLEEEHTLAIRQLVETASTGRIDEEATQFHAEKEKELTEQAEKHKSSLRELQRHYDDLLLGKQDLQQSIDKMRAAYDSALQAEKEKSARREMEMTKTIRGYAQKLHAAQEEAGATIMSLEDKLEEMGQWLAHEKQARTRADSALEEARYEINNLEMVNEALGQEYTSAVTKFKSLTDKPNGNVGSLTKTNRSGQVGGGLKDILVGVETGLAQIQDIVLD